jgi:hypothetical protein
MDTAQEEMAKRIIKLEATIKLIGQFCTELQIIDGNPGVTTIIKPDGKVDMGSVEFIIDSLDGEG